jgi:hypothetical protein
MTPGLGWLLFIIALMGLGGLAVLIGQLRQARRETQEVARWLDPGPTPAALEIRLRELLAGIQALHVALGRIQGRLDDLHRMLQERAGGRG